MSIVYKYRADDWENPISYLKEILKKRRLWFAAPSTFDDPSDMQLPIVGLFDTPLSIAEKRMVEISLRLDPTQNLKIVQHQVRLALLDGNLLQELQQGLGQALLDEVRQESGVLCLGSTATNNHLWEKYGGNFTGVCLGFKSELLGGYKPNPVEYLDTPRAIRYFEATKSEIRHAACLTKRLKYRAEEELRIVVPTKANQAFEFPRDALVSITFGPRISRKSRDSIQAYVRQKFPNATVS